MVASSRTKLKRHPAIDPAPELFAVVEAEQGPEPERRRGQTDIQARDAICPGG